MKYLLVERTTGTAAPGSPVIRHLLDAPGSMTFDPRTGTTLSLEIAAAPDAFALGQNYPNPFNPATNISYTVGSKGGATPVTIRVYDVLGKEVATLVNEVQQPGAYSTRWDAGGFASGVYYYRISAGSFSDVKTMILMK